MNTPYDRQQQQYERDLATAGLHPDPRMNAHYGVVIDVPDAPPSEWPEDVPFGPDHEEG